MSQPNPNPNPKVDDNEEELPKIQTEEYGDENLTVHDEDEDLGYPKKPIQKEFSDVIRYIPESLKPTILPPEDEEIDNEQ